MSGLEAFMTDYERHLEKFRHTAEVLVKFAAWAGLETPDTAQALGILMEGELRESQQVLYAKQMLKSRRQRRDIFGVDIFGEPAWEIILDMFIAQEEGRTVSLSSLSIAADVPASTAFRWINKLRNIGILIFKEDVEDQRRTLVELSPDYIKKAREFLTSTAHAIFLPDRNFVRASSSRRDKR